MEFFRIRKDIPFMRHALVFNVISLITFVLAVFFLATNGLNLSVEFTGGALIQVRYEEAADLEKVRGALEKASYTDFTVQNFGSSRDVLIRIPIRGTEGGGTDVSPQKDLVMEALAAGAPGASFSRGEIVGPAVGKELAEKGGTALLVVVAGIMIYLAFRFEWRYALSTILANLHDIVIILGFFAFFRWEFSLSVLAAVLAVLGYSVNESVVVFDRVRETFRKARNMTTPQVLDHAITSTISRTVITHGSTQVMVLSMFIFGGEALHNFSLALTIGICFGIYSSVLVASPVAMWLGISREQFIKPAKAKDPNVNDDGACV
ncbi:MAG: protein translocase subunit SecF [Zoogloeaceae bacterium]|jgi:preprotein translocase subunit SecF|nr:protein translocase subunit SecF [Zoogloeaceae bacterium]